MLKRSLLLATAIGLSLTATALADRPDYRADGSVRFGQKVFPTIDAWFASKEFRDSGARCGTPHLAEGDPLAFAPSDCTMASTTINPLYNDNREFIIQVVWHIIKRTDGVGDIPLPLIHSQMDVLNEDFQAIAGSLGAPGFNTKIKFVMARFDPQGNPTTGINVVTNNTYFNDPGPGAANAMKAALKWDTTRYFNIYTNNAAGNLGYATFPQQDAGSTLDGVVLLHSSVGRNAPQGGVYNLGRTATHEVGHYLGLFHTFQSGCGTAASPYTTGDLIADTNRERDPQFGCTPSASACAGAGMNPIENYMDYSDDRCMNKFTAEQGNRMRCAMTNFRSSQLNTAPKADFTYTAANTVVAFTNTSSDAESPLAMLKSTWTFGDGMMSTEASPMHTYEREGTYQVTLEVVDPGSGAATTMQSLVVVVPPPMVDAGIDPGGDDGGDGDGGGCCQAPNGDITFVLCGLPVVLVLLRRRRRA